MKRNYFLILLLSPLFLLAQNDQEKIQRYLNDNLSRLDLTQTDVSDWIIASKASSKTTKIIFSSVFKALKFLMPFQMFGLKTIKSFILVIVL